MLVGYYVDYVLRLFWLDFFFFSSEIRVKDFIAEPAFSCARNDGFAAVWTWYASFANHGENYHGCRCRRRRHRYGELFRTVELHARNDDAGFAFGTRGSATGSTVRRLHSNSTGLTGEGDRHGNNPVVQANYAGYAWLGRSEKKQSMRG
jgi:hypothetical protein